MSRTMTISSWSAANVTSRWSAGFSPKPASTSSYMRATRIGVLSNPSREGSSPNASSSSEIARSTRAVSTVTRRTQTGREESAYA